MRRRIQEFVDWGKYDAEDFAERWDVDADEVRDLGDRTGADKCRAIARAVREAADYFRTRGDAN